MSDATPAAAMPSAAAAAGGRAPFPVIVGCPRSGTSLLAVMLDAHPQLAVPPETAFLQHIATLNAPAADLARQFVQIVTADRTPISNWSDFGLDRDEFARRIAAILPFSVAAGTRAFYDMYAASQRKPRAGEKTPDNIFVMREIAALLPEAHFIHVLRDPRDTALSWRKTWFAPSQDFSILGQAWRYHVDAGRTAGATLPHYIETRYEDLVLRPQAELPRLCDFLQLHYAEAMRDPSAQGAARIARIQGRMHINGRMVTREDRTRIHANLARPPLAERVGVWKREMSAADRDAVERGAAPLLQALGYAADGQ
ncbi:MAG: sulfotransferase [Betaproteobacteria bacterium]